jgi:hypothetical protein
VTGIVPFTDNIRDLSNDQGYQFEFICERCGNGFRAPFEPDTIARGRSLLRAVGSLTGGPIERLGWAGEMLDRSTNSPAKDRAMQRAGEAVRHHFRQCRACGQWVCDDVCWNAAIGQCLTCSPHVADELSRAQAAAQVEQIQQRAREVDWTRDVDVTTRARVACPACFASIAGGKFCPECGHQLVTKTECERCGSALVEGAKFCTECGERA